MTYKDRLAERSESPDRELVTRSTPVHFDPPEWRAIVNKFCAETTYSLDAIIGKGPGRNRRLQLRIELALRLFSAGYRVTRIARIMGRSYSTIGWYVGNHPNKRQPERRS